MTGIHITKFHTLNDKQIVLADILSQVDQNFNNWHDQQLMASKHDTDYEHHNPSDLQSNTSDDRKLITHKDKSIPSVTMQDKYHTDIMDELVAMVGSNRNTVQGFINNMVGNTDAHTVVKDNNKINNKNIEQHANPLISESTCCPVFFWKRGGVVDQMQQDFFSPIFIQYSDPRPTTPQATTRLL